MTRLGGKVKKGDEQPAAVFGRRVAAVRNDRGWTQAKLAERLRELGYALPREALARLETGKRGASLEDVLAVAYALDVSPLHLIVPVDNEPRVIVAGNVQPVDPQDLREWIRGGQPLVFQDPMWFWGNRPRSEVVLEMDDIEAVRIGRPTSASAFHTRQYFAMRGELPPITEEEENG
jgi:transcriptional regulator with XRE-family HTH domain